MPRPSASGTGDIVRGTLPGAGAAIPYAIAFPHGVARADVHDVVYFLPGRGGTVDAALATYGGALSDVVRAGARPFALATLDGGESYYHARTGGEDRGQAARDELPRAVATAFGRAPRREAIAGYSMGGYGALLLAVQQPGRYAAVAVGAPALFTSFDAEDHAVGDAFDGRAQYAANDVFPRGDRLPRGATLIRIGDQDPFLAAVRAFTARYPHVRLEVAPGCHDGAFPAATGAPLLAYAAHRLR